MSVYLLTYQITKTIEVKARSVPEAIDLAALPDSLDPLEQPEVISVVKVQEGR